MLAQVLLLQCQHQGCI